ncbi:acyl carrier protein [Streptomyces spectabilis]|uniref:Acyl carrier protein n=1 Tax=Streptomyces spectabilis TaxID=68270 RepID=A0A7W8B522_STRST|nr:acyl carrier protein [Streptomyces spectabilis]MBB5110057.1 acyl carrier protein [Streptomyces spectabilis]
MRNYLLTVLEEKFDVAPDDVQPETKLSKLGFDSISTVELFTTLTDHFEGVSLDETGDISDQTVEDLIQAVAAQLPCNPER